MSETELKDLWREILESARDVSRRLGKLRAVARALSGAPGYESLRDVEKLLAKVEGLSLADAEDVAAKAQDAVRAVREWLADEWSRRERSTVEEIVEWFGERGVDVRRASDNGNELLAFPLELRVLAKKDLVQMYYAGELVAKAPASAEAVFVAWEKARRRLENNETAPDEFERELREAYEELLRLGVASKRAGARLPDIHFQMFVRRQRRGAARVDPVRRKLHEYPRAQFAWDLALWLSTGLPTDIALMEAGSSTSTPRTSVAIVEPSGNLRRYARIKVASSD